ncbi:MAG: hypothetical protein GY759_02255 [Chloroflexi bacterium]|nr:hypothetical protein [Chloroflexota bacterium]
MTTSLREISDTTERTAQAITYLTPKQRRDTQLAAIDVLIEYPTPEAHDSLFKLYTYYASHGPKRDPGAYMRHAILRALRPVTTLSDVPLLLDAVSTYEHLPPGFQEEAKLLRAGAIVILNELDDELAAYHAARLLVDGETDPMSGEPALVATKVLAPQNQMVTLYAYAMQATGEAVPEVVSECLRSLTNCPEALLPGILERYRESEINIVRIGLFDLLIQHDSGPLALEYLADSLLGADDLDVYQYLVITMISARQQALTDLIVQSASVEYDRQKLDILRESLSLYDTDPQILELLTWLDSNRN